MTEEAIERLQAAVQDEGGHSAGKYGPHVDGVLVSDLRQVLHEARRSMKSRAREVCMKRGHEFIHEAGERDDDPPLHYCMHCGAEYDDR